MTGAVELEDGTRIEFLNVRLDVPKRRGTERAHAGKAQLHSGLAP